MATVCGAQLLRGASLAQRLDWRAVYLFELDGTTAPPATKSAEMTVWDESAIAISQLALGL